jgi:hypothetical protein
MRRQMMQVVCSLAAPMKVQGIIVPLLRLTMEVVESHARQAARVLAQPMLIMMER